MTFLACKKVIRLQADALTEETMALQPRRRGDDAQGQRPNADPWG